MCLRWSAWLSSELTLLHLQEDAFQAMQAFPHNTFSRLCLIELHQTWATQKPIQGILSCRLDSFTEILQILSVLKRPGQVI